MANFDLWLPLNPLTDLTKICTGDYVGDIYHFSKFDPDQIRGFVSVHAWLRAPNCLLGYFLGVQEITYSQDAPTNFDTKYVKRRGSGEGCTFSGSHNHNL